MSMSLTPARQVVPWMVGALCAVTAAPTLAAADCNVSATTLVFGAYDTLSNSESHISATLTVSCVIVIGTLATVPYTISLSPSLTSGTMSRQMAGPMGSRLGYNLYTSAARSTVWGNGSGGTQTVANSVTPGSYGISAVQNHSVDGSLPVRQIVRPGSYSDGIVVTVDY